jgi:dihydrofolate synthase/folylpolyglutamate synthase
MLSQVLWKEFGYKVGLTTSPHLIKLNERVQVNGVMISDADLNKYLAQIYTITNDEQLSLSFFEHMILVAFLYFRDQHVEYAVIEVGL